MTDNTILQHTEKCLVCKHDLSEEVEYLRSQGYSYEEISAVLKEKYNISISSSAIKRHWSFANKLKLQKDSLEIDEVDKKYKITELEKMDVKTRMNFLNELVSIALARLTGLIAELSDPKRFMHLPTMQNLYSIAKMYDAMTRLYIDTSKIRLENEKINHDDLLHRLVEIATEIGVVEPIEKQIVQVEENAEGTSN
ncbi:MAG: hypothetical protein N2Z58_09395 [Fervidobacterium sp.]|nr:hypothetical protein [Fervidobacterium sp.]